MGVYEWMGNILTEFQNTAFGVEIQIWEECSIFEYMFNYVRQILTTRNLQNIDLFDSSLPSLPPLYCSETQSISTFQLDLIFF